MTQYNTMQLNSRGDLDVDSAGNFVISAPPYSQAQDVASEVKTILGECYYDSKNGVPYYTKILGYMPATSLIVEQCNKAALRVPGVVAAQTTLTSFNRATRLWSGSVKFINEDGEENNVKF